MLINILLEKNDLLKPSWSSQVAQWVKDPPLSLLWLESLLRCGFSPGPGTSVCCGEQPPPPKKKKKTKQKQKNFRPNPLVMNSLSPVFWVLFFFFSFFTATPAAYGSSQAMGPI